MFGKRFSRALAVTTIASLVMATAAFADTIVVNDLATGSDATVAPGATGSAQVYLIAQNGSGGSATHPGDNQGCNAGGIGSGQATRVTFSSSDLNVSIASPGYVDLEACDDPATTAREGAKSIGYSVDSSTLPGTYTITGTASGGKAGSIYNNDSMTLTVQVAVTNQAPTTPGKPSGTSPNQGAFTLSWAASTDDGLPTGSFVTYSIRGQDADNRTDGTYVAVATGLATTSFVFDADPDTAAPQAPEGTWTYQVQASDSALTSAWSGASDSIVVDRTDPEFGACSGGPFVLNSGSQSVSITASDPTLPDGSDGSGLDNASSTLTGSVNTSTVGRKTVTFTAADLAGNSLTTTCSYSVAYNFTGFTQPVDNNGVLNVVKAGQAVPLKFRLTDANGDPVLSGVSASVSVASLVCSSGTSGDLIEEVASGSSGLQNLGDGYYQFNWKTPTTYANSCKTMRLNLGEGGPTLIGSPLAPNPDAVFHTALFQFKK